MSKINRLMHFYNKNISYQRKNGIWRSRHVAILIACLIMLTPLKVIAAEENLNVNEFPQLQSETAVLMDAETGQILYQKEMNKKMYPASITKIVTGMLALKNAQLTETITMSYDAVFSIDRDSSHIALDVNEQITLEQALYALTIESANDAANGIAELVGGSMEEFVDMMNQTAKDAGAINTNFSNAHGLFDENHYTTSYDMAKNSADYILNVSDSDTLIRSSAITSIRQIVGESEIDYILTEGKTDIEKNAKNVLQETMDKNGTGIEIVNVQLVEAAPPTAVLGSFQDLATARQDRSIYINEALSYQNTIIPQAKADAYQQIAEAEAYREDKISTAEGDAALFVQRQEAYSKSKRVTEFRLYMEAMDQILPNVQKILLGANVNIDNAELWITGKGTSGSEK